MREIRPWCVSRQLWWGHRIPVWYCDACEETIVAERRRERCGACGGELRQEEDVLDTWFSSALWPFATLGWPDDTPELRAFYPTNFLTTAREILFLWVARMMMMGIEFAGDIPFRDVYVHSVIQARDGRRMSKSLGTGIDPLEEIDVHGADALRFGLLAMSSTQDVRFSDAKVQQGRDLANKLWNARRLILLNAADASSPRRGRAAASRTAGSSRGWSGRSPRSPTKLEAYDFAHAVQEAYSFFWRDLCDWYLEIVKPRLYDGEAEVSATLLYVLERVLALLHPTMPFVTEEIWSFHPARAGPPRRAPVPGRRRVALRRGGRGEVEGGIALTQRLRAWRDLVGVPAGGGAAGADRRRRAARVRRPPRALRVRRRRRRAGRLGRPGPGPRLGASSTPRRSRRAWTKRREELRGRGRARRAQARQRGLRRQGAGRGGRGGARQARALPGRTRRARVSVDGAAAKRAAVAWPGPGRLPRLAGADRLAARARADAQADARRWACPSTASPRSTWSAPTASPRSTRMTAALLEAHGVARRRLPLAPHRALVASAP